MSTSHSTAHKFSPLSVHSPISSFGNLEVRTSIWRCQTIFITPFGPRIIFSSARTSIGYRDITVNKREFSLDNMLLKIQFLKVVNMDNITTHLNLSSEIWRENISKAAPTPSSAQMLLKPHFRSKLGYVKAQVSVANFQWVNFRKN